MKCFTWLLTTLHCSASASSEWSESLGAARLFQCELFYTFRKVDGLA